MKEEEIKRLKARAKLETNPVLKKAIEDKIKQLDKTISK